MFRVPVQESSLSKHLVENYRSLPLAPFIIDWRNWFGSFHNGPLCPNLSLLPFPRKIKGINSKWSVQTLFYYLHPDHCLRSRYFSRFCSYTSGLIYWCSLLCNQANQGQNQHKIHAWKIWITFGKPTSRKNKNNRSVEDHQQRRLSVELGSV